MCNIIHYSSKKCTLLHNLEVVLLVFCPELMALFHRMVRYGSARLGTVRYGSVRVGLRFHRSLVPL